MSMALSGVLIFVILIFSSIYYGVVGRNGIAFSAILFLLVFPYRSLFIEYAGCTDTFIDLYLFAEFLLIATRGRITLSEYHVLFIGGFLLSTALFSISEGGLSFLVTVPDTRFLIGMFIFITILISTTNNRESLVRVIKLYAMNSIALVLIDFIAFVMFRNPYFGVELLGKNSYALYQFLGLLFIFYLLRNRIWQRRSAMLFLLLEVADMLLVKSSSVIICFVLSLFVFYVLPLVAMGGKKSIRAFYTVVVIVATVVLVFIVQGRAEGSQLIAAFMKVRNHEDYFRLAIWQEAFKTFLQNPLYGIGAENFEINIAGVTFVTHNDYLRLLAETGIIGFCSFAIFSLHTAKIATSIRDNTDRKLICALILSMFVFILFHGYINFVPFHFAVAIPYLFYQTEAIPESFMYCDYGIMNPIQNTAYSLSTATARISQEPFKAIKTQEIRSIASFCGYKYARFRT